MRAAEFQAAKQQKTKSLGTIEGVVTFSGKVPQSKVADNAGQRRELLTVDRKTRGLRFVVAYLDLQATGRSIPDGTAQADKPVVIDQIEHTFVPRLLAVRDGQTVKFTNSDAANHNVRATSFEDRNVFNIFTGAGAEYEHCFYTDKKSRPVMLGCDIHPWMKAWVFVFEHPYFAVTDKKGKFRISQVPPGNYSLVVRQPDVPYRHTKKIVVSKGETLEVNVEIDSKDPK